MANKDMANKHELSSNNFIIVSALITLVAVILSFVAGRALFGQIVLNSKVISKKSIAADQLQKNLENIPTLKANHAALGPNAKLILDSLPDKQEYPAIVSTIETIAGLSSVKLKSVSPVVQAASVSTNPSTPPSQTGPQQVPLTVTVEGTYENILKFFSNMELSSRPLKVVSISQQGPTASQQLKADAVTYWQAPADLSLKMETVK